MRIATAVFVACTLAIGPRLSAASSYSITTSLDDGTQGDLSILASGLLSSSDGEAPRALRKLAAGAVGELLIALKQRIEAGALLRLDDGSVAALVEGDQITITSNTGDCPAGDPNCSPTPGATIFFQPDGKGPALIVINQGNGCTRVMSFDGDGGKPSISTKCPPRK